MPLTNQLLDWLVPNLLPNSLCSTWLICDWLWEDFELCCNSCFVLVIKEDVSWREPSLSIKESVNGDDWETNLTSYITWDDHYRLHLKKSKTRQERNDFFTAWSCCLVLHWHISCFDLLKLFKVWLRKEHPDHHSNLTRISFWRMKRKVIGSLDDSPKDGHSFTIAF